MPRDLKILASISQAVAYDRKSNELHVG